MMQVSDSRTPAVMRIEIQLFPQYRLQLLVRVGTRHGDFEPALTRCAQANLQIHQSSP